MQVAVGPWAGTGNRKQVLRYAQDDKGSLFNEGVPLFQI
jgi:hypothetical protein